MKKKKSTRILSVVFTVVAMSLLTTVLSGCQVFNMVINLLKGAPPTPEATYDEVAEYQDEYRKNWWYLGTSAYMENFTEKSSFSLQEFIGDYFGVGAGEATWISSNPTVATMEGDEITIIGTGELSLTITKNSTGESVTQKFIVVEGVNIYTFEDLYTATNLSRPVILQQDLTLADATTLPADNFGCTVKSLTMSVSQNMYGNGHRVYAQDLTFKSATNTGDWFRSVFAINGNLGVTIDGFYISGRTCEDGEKRTIGDFEPYGILFEFYGNGSKSVSEYDLPNSKYLMNYVKNCIIENGNRLVTVSDSRVTFEGCYIRNGADSCISVGTFEQRSGADIVFKDSVLENGLVATILFYCYQGGVNPTNFARLKFEGFVELFNWKNTNNTSLMPEAEPLGSVVNPIIAGELSNKNYADLFYWTEDKKVSYVNCGILVIATGGAKRNEPEFIGMEEQKFNKRKLPLPSAAGAFINVCQVIGYDVAPPIIPEQLVDMNAEKLNELFHGRAK